MTTNNPNNTPDLADHDGCLVRLVRSSYWHVADQAREMGLKVGDVIIGREGGGDPETGWWQEQRLTLRYLGEQCCVWKSEWRNKALPEFREDGESANWTLSCRDWYLVRQSASHACRVCGGKLRRGIALIPGIYGSDDFGGDLGQTGTTMSEGPATKGPVDCLKCEKCGHSFIPRNAAPITPEQKPNDHE